ncbi:hypothetical protein AGLY_001493 [Aphis glycines]|uniref:Uncharacterized protein n=1 Tax=Aphis glycines TaxID=307491 RepID=A0A6G0U5G3_APHGL|nr:hypothetical protein AGLY_001493 [Aphis glycines]
MAFCGSSRRIANQHATDLLYTTFQLVIIIIGCISTYLNYSRLKTKYNAVIYTSNPAGSFKAPNRCHHIAYTSTIIIDSSSILHSEEDKNKTNHSCMNRCTDIYIRSCTPRPHHYAHTCTLYYTHSHKSDLDHYYHFYYYNVRVLLLLLLLLLLNIGSENRSVIFNEFASKYVNTTFST